ncbi:TlpA family protein disulfide reductase [Shinella daejeonensis]|uniref:TlpA disulfide reductase family protein n=1 Tax=Shinella daejeonensis TaxID=659017 RepID=UPI0020C74A1E|nr:TlpA disulfide reductase family protein [Shinella daejeonensis]MCP8895147.1 TlpA family protein disulfide reductase [Shinella daejeonensis]
MNAVAIGPFAFASDRFAAIVGILVFMIAASVLSARVDRRLGSWSMTALLAGIAMARAVHVLRHIDSFADAPARIIAFWQGGFSPIGGAIGVVAASLWIFRRSPVVLPWSAASLAAGLFAWTATATLTGGGAAPPAPAQSFATMGSERTVAIADRNGRPAVLNLWASWCPPCRREMPMMVELAQENPQVDFLFANQGESLEAIDAYLRQSGLEIPTVLRDPFADLSRHYAAPGLPATLFINPDGSLSTSHLGEISKEALSQAIDRFPHPQESRPERTTQGEP